mmetsp:Transcript_6209/g.11808  ORF Transcript_6209/g.11808 Transcript_6209/m.11808 type:complete len:112 (-) Transcript_6209:2387-2722(-)
MRYIVLATSGVISFVLPEVGITVAQAKPVEEGPTDAENKRRRTGLQQQLRQDSRCPQFVQIGRCPKNSKREFEREREIHLLAPRGVRDIHDKMDREFHLTHGILYTHGVCQ